MLKKLQGSDLKGWDSRCNPGAQPPPLLHYGEPDLCSTDLEDAFIVGVSHCPVCIVVTVLKDHPPKKAFSSCGTFEAARFQREIDKCPVSRKRCLGCPATLPRS